MVSGRWLAHGARREHAAQRELRGQRNGAEFRVRQRLKGIHRVGAICDDRQLSNSLVRWTVGKEVERSKEGWKTENNW